MTVASIFARSYASVAVAAVVDVQQILDAIATLLTVTIPVAGDRWTLTAANTYESPADPVSGARMKIAFVRASATEIQMTPTDKDGVGTGTTHAIGGWAGQVCKIYAGPTHFFMKIVGFTANDEDFQCYVVDPTPEAMNASFPVNFARSMRVNGNGTNNIPLETFRGRDGLTASYQARLSFPGYSANPGVPNGTLLTAGGSELAFPAFFSSFPGATLANNRGSGAVPQAVWVDQTHVEGQLIVVPIDVGVTAVFEVTATLCDGFGPTGAARLAFRVG